MSWSRSIARAFGRPLTLLRRHLGLVLAGSLFIPVHAAVSLWMPRLLGNVLDELQGGGSKQALRDTCWLLLGLAIVES
ncbi:MAG: hypothetical protein ABIP94_08190, partial [Planctomycetota bacterium]